MFDSRGVRRQSLSGKQLRLSRLFAASSRRSLVVPIDHSVTIGPLGRSDHADSTADLLARAGADALIVHKGRARTIDPWRFGSLGLIVHLSAGTNLSIDRTGKVLVGSVEECLGLGADAVSVHVNVGSASEPQQLIDLGAVSGECSRLGVPLLAMMYARGPEIGVDATSVPTLSHLAAIATDLGADVVKLDYAGSPDQMNEVVDSCPLPILVAGGPAVESDAAAIDFGIEVASSRVAGLSFGRQIFAAEQPQHVAAALADHLHGAAPSSRALTPTLELA
ncbi:2-amino-3,7-dideoxy-D-threo-hept-6-ulosonate synthase [Gordonia insulae]|uniref:2-amino-4, 5-dihydroxy-6-oxo-7-(Phosphonooxy)heptanoate synthase n=1 Tax=Gordonia insulae TaxID=2420509 RepID=A0A3G8JL20_9ACTN|nr:2-amino-3,7-dideoxy-D-threo-hept-6-ulosonate synthase [Gordonia insulae]AZG45713.1 2-amino-4,5-dihydroxy-6-oxo-7-(phosphonooxy)heptanoate synthase [Gordonia insulae]